MASPLPLSGTLEEETRKPSLPTGPALEKVEGEVAFSLDAPG